MWITAVNLLVFVAAGAVILLNARTAVRTEVAAAQASAVDLIRANLTADALPPSGAEFAARFAAMAQPRHVRIALPEGGVPETPALAALPPDAPPRWFHSLIASDIQPVEIRARRSDGGENRVMVLAVPDDEVEEVWEDVRALFLVWGGAALLQTVALALVTGRALAPLARLDHSLRAIEAGDLAARVGPVPTADLVPIARRIDTLAQSLSDERGQRQQMTRRFMELRDSERRGIARDLHDELGPCLFGLTVAADAIAGAADPAQLPHVDMILRHVASIRSINRRISDAVRPATLGKLPLPEVIRDLVGDLEDLHRDVSIDCQVDGDLPAADDAVSLSLYRAIQEGVTNALRHGRARRVQIRLSRGQHDAREAIRLVVRDDGRGLGRDWRHGGGLMGMLERAVAIGGLFSIRDTGEGGAELSLLLPVGAIPA